MGWRLVPTTPPLPKALHHTLPGKPEDYHFYFYPLFPSFWGIVSVAISAYDVADAAVTDRIAITQEERIDAQIESMDACGARHLMR